MLTKGVNHKILNNYMKMESFHIIKADHVAILGTLTLRAESPEAGAEPGTRLG